MRYISSIKSEIFHIHIDEKYLSNTDRIICMVWNIAEVFDVAIEIFFVVEAEKNGQEEQ